MLSEKVRITIEELMRVGEAVRIGREVRMPECDGQPSLPRRRDSASLTRASEGSRMNQPLKTLARRKLLVVLIT
jgi:hypothetical protein